MESNGDLHVPILTDETMNVDDDNSQHNPVIISRTEQCSKLQTENTILTTATAGALETNGKNAETDAAVSMKNIVEEQLQNSNIAPLGTTTAHPGKRIEDAIPSGFCDDVANYVNKCPTENLDTESTDQNNLNANAPPRQNIPENFERGVPLSKNNDHNIMKSTPISTASSNFFFCDESGSPADSETDGPSTAIIGDRPNASQSPLTENDDSRRLGLTNQLSDLSGYNAPIAEINSTADTTASVENQKNASKVDSTFREQEKRTDSSRGGSSKDEHPNESTSTNSALNHINEGRKMNNTPVSSGMDGKHRDPMELRQAQAPPQFAFQQYPSVGQMHPIQHIMYPTGAYDHMGAVQPQIPPQYHATHGMNPAMMQPMTTNITTSNPAGRRSIHLHLMQEESAVVYTPQNKLARASFLFRRDPNHSRAMSLTTDPSTNRLIPKSLSAQSLTLLEKDKFIDKGSITVSWYDGTSASELQGHVKRSVIRKLRLEKGLRVQHIRIIDERVVPSEEIVLSPHIPDGSDFLLNFTIRDTREEDDEKATNYYQQQYAKQTKAPDSPSAAPIRKSIIAKGANSRNGSGGDAALVSKLETNDNGRRASEIKTIETVATDSSAGYDETDDDLSIDPDDPVEERLRTLHDLLLLQKLNVKVANKRKKVGELKTKGIERHEREEKRQVIFVIANYFVLFLSFIAISAEIQSRAPHWMEWVEYHVETVQNCGHDRDALLQCVERGDIAGLIASLILFLSRSVAAKQFFLFGFDSPGKLWTVVYESFVTAICWGTSYIFIRRGLNPDTRTEFLQRYWKDAVYGSLAGFNAAFMKAILKNLIPQQVVEEALMDRRVKIVDWILSLG
eukprot:CAMPEP_0198286650 /NCGR_PEP_ID=MMETSP1449-20131203/5675_1 /TAXON_ID=420275 /ORGANISM="Attheya septentrionalis, Strain CCMP2084" /LENGTH=849 /DNA_ID=CAMNT_0043984435 /DNA_START=260 /DNA_END=2809 /DNA_ORIENTATION=+